MNQPHLASGLQRGSSLFLFQGSAAPPILFGSGCGMSSFGRPLQRTHSAGGGALPYLPSGGPAGHPKNCWVVSCDRGEGLFWSHQDVLGVAPDGCGGCGVLLACVLEQKAARTLFSWLFAALRSAISAQYKLESWICQVFTSGSVAGEVPMRCSMI